MQFIVVPFVAAIGKKQDSKEVASQLQELIQRHTAQGWEYVRLESVTTQRAGDAGCFGIGATPPTMEFFSVAVFRQKRAE